jgi:hypothetical protein
MIVKARRPAREMVLLHQLGADQDEERDVFDAI